MSAGATDRVSLLGLLASSLLLAAHVRAPALHPHLPTVLVAVETLLFLPWAAALLGAGRATRWAGALRGKNLVHGLLLLLLMPCLCLAHAWQAVLAQPDDQARQASHAWFVTIVLHATANLGLLSRGRRLNRLLLRTTQQPGKLTPLSFGFAILVGALLLSFPQALARDASPPQVIDTIFTAVSAVCVTGLVVHGTGATYSGFGQAAILALIQVGALGMMAMYAALAVLTGRELRLRTAAAITDILDARSLAALRGTLRSIVVFTLLLEALGTAILFAALPGDAEVYASEVEDHGPRLWIALFHSVSAFCNAGFTILHDGVRPFVGSPLVCTTLMLLITVGGLGFPVLAELQSRFRARMRGVRPARLSLHTRVVLATSGILVLLGFVLFAAGEARGVLATRPVGERILASLFQSVTARTAGFSTLPIGEFSAGTLMGLSILMLIGASPGSTGGGIKTTTAAVLFTAFRRELTTGGAPILLDRTIAPKSVAAAARVFCCSVGVLALATLVLLFCEDHPPLALAFEATSAFGTVGLSTGITPQLSTVGKIVLIVTMFVGRVGPLSAALVLVGAGKRLRAAPVEESVRIG